MCSISLTPQTTHICTFCVAFHIFIVNEYREVTFGVQVDHSKSQPIDDKLSQKGRVHVVTHLKYLVPLKYLWDGLSYRLHILYTVWPCEVLAIGLTK